MNLRLITLLIIFLFSLEKGVFAHDLDKHESFGIIPILPNILLWISLFFVGFIWFKLISSLNHIKDSRAIKISKIIGFSFLLWLIVIILQNWSLKGNNYNPILHSIPFNVGYIVLPFTLLSLLRLAYILSRKYLRELFKTPRYWFYFSGIIFLYSFFYLFASGLFVSSLIALPSSEDLPRSSNSFLLFSKTYGPLTMWDTVDFWLPNIKLYGVVSIGTLMMMLSVSILMAVNIFMRSEEHTSELQSHS